MTKATPVIEFQDIKRVFKMGDNTFYALKGISFVVEPNEMLAVIGPSGSGKSTTMNIIGLLDSATSGQYLLDGKDVTKLTPKQRAVERNHSIGFIFQSFFLLSRLTAEQNVMLPLMYRGVSKKECSIRAQEVLERVGMLNHAHHKPAELSGGQQQRVAIARALVGRPRLILADEPTGALDQNTSGQVMELLHELNTQDKSTVVVITHDPEIADKLPRRIPIVDGLLVEKTKWI